MGYPLRCYLPDTLYEATIRTGGGYFLLRPDPTMRDKILGIIGRALKLFPAVRLHAFDCQSNHLHQLLSSSDGWSIADYLRYVHSCIARLVAATHGWRARVWGSRVRVIPIVDNAAAIARLRYVMAQGVAAGLVASPKDWPGASSIPGLIGTMVIPARWTSTDRARRNALLTKPRASAELVEVVDIRLTPIPPWSALSASALRARHLALVADIEREHAGRKVLGPRRVTQADPFSSPSEFIPSPAPRCHASSPPSAERWGACYAAFGDAFRAAAAAAKVRAEPLGRGRGRIALRPRDGAIVDATSGRVVASFPPGSCPRPPWYVPLPSDGPPPVWAGGIDSR